MLIDTVETLPDAGLVVVELGEGVGDANWEREEDDAVEEAKK